MRCHVLYLFILFIITFQASGQDSSKWVRIHHFDPPEAEIEAFVSDSVQEWQQKGMFETTEAYKNRVNKKTKQKLIKRLTQHKLDQLISDFAELELKDCEYDADHEVFRLSFYGMKPAYVKVPNGPQSRQFYENRDSLIFKEVGYTLTQTDEIALAELTVKNPVNNRAYQHEIGQELKFKEQRVDQHLSQITVDYSGKSIEQARKANKDQSRTALVDKKIPEVPADPQSNTFAVIIGNENYSKHYPTFTKDQNVPYAINDAKTFARYCHLTLGIPKENIKTKINVYAGEMSRSIDWLKTQAQYRDSVELIFYYAGHGMPDDKTKEKYLLPVGLGPNQVDRGIKLDKLYDELTQHESQSVTVFLDACFSGAGRNSGLMASARGVYPEPKENAILNDNLVIFASTQAKTKSFPYPAKQHGIFTYYLLKKLKAEKGKVSYGELENYLTQKVPLKSFDLHPQKQVPKVKFSQSLEDEWKEWSLR